MRYIAIIIVLIFSFINLLSLEISYTNNVANIDTDLLSSFYRADIEDNSTIPDSTKAWIWRSSRYLHIHWEVEIDSNFTRGQFTPEDKMPESDFLRIQIITTPSDPFSYGFYAFPLENKYDDTRDEDLDTDSDWDSNYQYTSEITDRVWIVEMQIPFRDLRFSGSAPYNWKIILSRYYENDETIYHLPNLYNTSGKDYFRKALPISISQSIKRDKIFSLKPYIITNYDLIDEEMGELSSDNIGLDLTIKPATTSKLKISINPDFSDVPLDNATDTSNLKYAPTFSENRYFFTEDYDAFGVGSGLFYSRNILQPEYGVKGTFKSDKLSVAFLLTQDKKTYTYEEDEEGNTYKILENNNDIYHLASLRYQTQKFNIQGTFLSRDSDDWCNKLYHLKPSWEFMPNWTVYADLNYSRYINTLNKQQTEQGYYGKLGFDVNRNNFYLYSYINNMSEDFMAEMGSINEKNSYSYQVEANQIFPINKKIVKALSTNLFSESKWKNDNDLMYRNIRWKNTISFQNKLTISFNALLEQENPSGNIHNVDYLETELNYRKHRTFAPIYLFRYAHTIHYERDQIYQYVFQRFGLYSRLTSHIILSGYLDNFQYLDFTEKRLISVDESTSTSNYKWDDSNFLVGNLDASINLSNNITFKIGYRHNGNVYKFQTVDNSNNEVLSSSKFSSQQGVYTNLTLVIKNSLNIYFGYRSSFYEYNLSNVKDYNNLYLKLSYSY